ncbi:MAG: ZIP family metal transporter [Aureibaculum sp.]|nr:ZIP family metal transporter [Aureibaculum sp.]
MNVLALLLSVIVGVLLVLGLKPHTKIIQLFLSFSGAYLLSITVLHLLPEVYESQQANIGLYILIGILLQSVLEYFSKGAEHGHIHAHPHLKGIPWLLFISLSLHAFFEGIPLGVANGNLLLWAIVVHKIPITVVLFIFLLNAELSKKYIYIFMVVFALMSPLGLSLSKEMVIFDSYHVEITAIIIGIFLHIATAILFESTQNHQFNFKKFISVLVGFSVAFISTQLGA